MLVGRVLGICTALVLMAAALASPASAGFPGANGRLVWDVAYCEGGAACTTGIYTANPDGSGLTYLTPGFNPAWSPDGTKIAYETARIGASDVWVMNFDGSNRHWVAFGTDPAWSPDGHTILFSANTETFPAVVDGQVQLSEFDLFTVQDDGSGLQQLTTVLDPCTSFIDSRLRPCGEHDAAWSPDGSQIAFGRGREGNDLSGGDIVVIGADGSGYRELTGQSWTSGSDPDWSPDGARIAFSGQYRIRIVDRSGSGLTTLQPPVAGQDNYAPAWSPDGTRIAFRSMRWPGADSEIWVTDPDGGHPANVTNTAGAAEMNPDWAPKAVFPFSGFLRPVRGPGIDGIEAGSAVPIRFGLGGDRGLQILDGDPTTAPVDCTTLAATGPAEPAETAGASGLAYDPASGTYRYVWKTKRAWRGTCRSFTLALTDGTKHSAMFRLG